MLHSISVVHTNDHHLYTVCYCCSWQEPSRRYRNVNLITVVNIKVPQLHYIQHVWFLQNKNLWCTIWPLPNGSNWTKGVHIHRHSMTIICTEPYCRMHHCLKLIQMMIKYRCYEWWTNWKFYQNIYYPLACIYYSWVKIQDVVILFYVGV